MLYLECYSGISGDMTVAALLDLGASREKLLAGLESLGVDGYRVEIGRRSKCGVEAASFDVILDGPQDGGSHDYEEGVLEEHDHCHVHGGDHVHDHCHVHGGDHGHDNHHVHEGDCGHEHHHVHEGDHDHDHHHDGGHPHVHRSLPDIIEILERSAMTPGAKELAERIFRIVAEAEAGVHGKPVDQVHFHEVGAVDSIVDIAAAAICLGDLGIREAVVSGIAAGSGHVHCQHGILPVPVPAVTAIAQSHGLTLLATDTKGELATPTGAAIAAGIRTRDKLPEAYRILKTGMGAGKKDFPKANILRAYLIEEAGEDGGDSRKDSGEKLWMLETNIDDSTGEALGYVMEKLLEAGARDVCYIPAFMKKNRPAYLMKVICEEKLRETMEDLIFRHTTTIGIRRFPMERTALSRRMVTVETPYGPARLKETCRGGQVFRYPEYEDVARIADASGMSFREAYEAVFEGRQEP